MYLIRYTFKSGTAATEIHVHVGPELPTPVPLYGASAIDRVLHGSNTRSNNKCKEWENEQTTLTGRIPRSYRSIRVVQLI